MRPDRRHRAFFFGLEDRTLLTGVIDLALSLPIGHALVGTLAAFGASFYKVDVASPGRLTADVVAKGFPSRLSFVDAQGHPLLQSDAPSIDIHVPAGPSYLEIQSLGKGGAFTIEAGLSPTDPPFHNVPADFQTGPSSVALGNFLGSGSVDLLGPDGIHAGVGDGTFATPTTGTSVFDPANNPALFAVGKFTGGTLDDVAVAELGADFATPILRILINQGGGHFETSATFPIDSPNTILAADLGNGNLAIIIASQQTDQIQIFRGNGQGHFTPSPAFNGGPSPAALAVGSLKDGHVDLIVANRSNPSSGDGITIFQSDGISQVTRTEFIPLPDEAPSALVLGDFGNGHLGVAVAGENHSDVTIFLGRGDGTLSRSASYRVGQNPQFVKALDVNGDGHIDLVTANSNSGDVSVLLGIGDANGTFGPAANFGAGTSPAVIDAADLNGDGRPDLVVANINSNDISVLPGRGDGTFVDHLANNVGAGLSATISGDFNRDGHLDVVTVNQSAGTLSVLLGNGDGTFASPITVDAGVSPYAVAEGDFNGDGRLDLAVTDKGDSNNKSRGQGVSIFLGNGDGTFQPHALVQAGRLPSGIVAGDFTGHGKIDLAVVNQEFRSNNVSILAGDGFGGFKTLPPIPLGDGADQPDSITAGDFGNGRLDLAVGNISSDNVSILLRDENGIYHAQSPIPLEPDASHTVNAIVAGHFRNASQLDLAVATSDPTRSQPDHVTILQATGVGTFTLGATIDLNPGADPRSLTVADINGDGLSDVVTADLHGKDLSVILGNASGVFQRDATIPVTSGGYPVSVTAGDFSGGTPSDLAIGNQGPNHVAVLLNQGGGRFIDPDRAVLAPHNTPLVADLNGDGVADLTLVNGAGDILFRGGRGGTTGGFDPPVTVNPGIPSRDVTVLKTATGMMLASVDAADNFVSLFVFRNGIFTRTQTLETGKNPAEIVSTDLNLDHVDDLIVRNAGDASLTIYRSDGRGGFAPRSDLPIGEGASGMAVADVDGNGLPDLLIAYASAGVVEVRLYFGGSSFGPPTTYRAGGGLLSVGDGSSPFSMTSSEGTAGVVAGRLGSGDSLSLVTLNPGSETFGVLTGLGNGRFANATVHATNTPATVARIADLDGDGTPDVALLGPDGVTIEWGDGRGGFRGISHLNAGRNPRGLTIADVNGDGLPDLIIGDAAGDVLVLNGTRDADGTRSFSTARNSNQGVALAVSEIPGRDRPQLIIASQALDQVIVRADPKSSGIVVGDRSSGLLAPGAVTAADLNGDGIPDLIVANSGGNNVLVYLGLADGRFGPELNGGKGFITGTNPVSITVADVDGTNRPDLIVANRGSNDVTILFNRVSANGSGITFVAGPRIKAGAGPVATAFDDVNGDHISDLVVSNANSDNLFVFQGRGGGFFNDTNPTVISLSQSPGQVFIGNYAQGTGNEIVTLNPRSNTITMISSLSMDIPVIQPFSSGGFGPTSAVSVNGPGPYDDLIVANTIDGHVSVLSGGPLGLSVIGSSREIPGVSALAFSSLHENSLEIFAASEGNDTAALLTFVLGGLPSASTGSNFNVVAGKESVGLSLLRLTESSLPLIATLLIPLNETEISPDVNVALTSQAATVAAASASLGQGPIAAARASDATVDDDTDADKEAESGKAREARSDEEASPAPPWLKSVLGLDEAFEEFRLRVKSHPLHEDASPERSIARPPVFNAPQAHSEGLRSMPVLDPDPDAAVDAAIASFDEPLPESPIATHEQALAELVSGEPISVWKCALAAAAFGTALCYRPAFGRGQVVSAHGDPPRRVTRRGPQ